MLKKTAIPTVLKRGDLRLYFPEFPDHELNGVAFEYMGAKTGTRDGLVTRTRLTGFLFNVSNQINPPGYWSGTFDIIPAMFGVESLKVNFCYYGRTETFILDSKK